MMQREGRRALVRRKYVIFLLAMMATALVASGCSGSDASPKSDGHKAKKPIVIGLASTVIPGVYDGMAPMQAAMDAAQAYIKDHGGWGGREVKFETCSSDGSPAADQKCVRQMVSANVVTSLSLLTNAQTVELPLFKSAGIPFFETNATGLDSEPLETIISGDVGRFTAAARYMCVRGVKKAAAIIDDNGPTRQAFKDNFVPTAKKCGIDYQVVYAPGNAPDQAPFVQKAVGGNPDMLFISTGQPVAKSLSATATAGFPAKKVIVYPTTVSPDLLTDPDANGVIFIAGPLQRYFLPQLTQPSEEATEYYKYMKQVSPKVDASGSQAAVNFSQLVTIWRSAKTIGFDKFDAKTLAANLKNGANLDIFMGGKVATVRDKPAVRQPYMFMWRLQDRQAIALGWWAGYWSCSTPQECKSTEPPQ